MVLDLNIRPETLKVLATEAYTRTFSKGLQSRRKGHQVQASGVHDTLKDFWIARKLTEQMTNSLVIRTVSSQKMMSRELGDVKCVQQP